MKLTKYGHACIVFEDQGKKLVLDPGAYTDFPADLTDVIAIVVTHEHGDHFFEPSLEQILGNNPEAMIFGTPSACKKVPHLKTTPVYHGDHYEVGPFTIEFFGDLHAVIHSSIPVIENRGVLINDKFYYPGDSFTQPDRKVELLAVPTSAPWLKISEVMDFVAAVKHSHSMATHNALNSDFGNSLSNDRVKMVTESQGGQFHYLLPGDSLEI